MNTEESSRVFGQNILSLIQKRNWSFQAAACELHYDREDLSKLTVGMKNFRLETAIRFARFFNVSLFLLFSRLFGEAKYQEAFVFVDADYMDVLRANFKGSAAKQADIDLDSTTMWQIMHGQRGNLTIRTLEKIAQGSKLPLSELLKTDQDKAIEAKIKEEIEHDLCPIF